MSRKKVIETGVLLLFVLFFGVSQSEKDFGQLLSSLIGPEDMISTTTTGTSIDRVVDGDTVVAFINGKKETIRLIGINAPESVDPRRPVECFGREASSHLKELLPKGTSVTIESDPTQTIRDKYDRLLGYVFASTTNINKQMIDDGYAYEYTYDLPYKYQSEFKAAERDARISFRGLWSPSSCNGIK